MLSWRADWNVWVVLNATVYALSYGSTASPFLSVAAAICSAAGQAVSARKRAASSSDGFCTKLADSSVCAICPGLGSRRKPTADMTRSTRQSCSSGTPARSAMSGTPTEPRSGRNASTWKCSSQRKHASTCVWDARWRRKSVGSYSNVCSFDIVARRSRLVCVASMEPDRH